MMKTMALVLAIVLSLSVLMPIQAEARNPNRIPGGVPAFFIGCCFGLREGTMWNEGADLHWREWAPIIPFVGFVFAIWNGIDAAGGMTSVEFNNQYGANWY